MFEQYKNIMWLLILVILPTIFGVISFIMSSYPILLIIFILLVSIIFVTMDIFLNYDKQYEEKTRSVSTQTDRMSINYITE